MDKNEISEESIPIAAEDRFLVFNFGSGRSLGPNANDAMHLGDMVRSLGSGFDLTPVFDLRGLEGYYNDIDMFIQSVGGPHSFVLIGEEEVEAGWESILQSRRLVPVLASGEPIGTTLLEHDSFDVDAEHYFEAVADDSLSYNEALEASFDLQFDELCNFVSSIHRNSLLVEFAMSHQADNIQLTPYHSHAVHNIETTRDSVLVARPGVIAQTTGAVFSSEISDFQRLINNPETRERHIQKFLEQHPAFLCGLNYQNIYPQIILEREGKGTLRPDFILEPYDDAFCDILDVKLPFQKVFVGKTDRATLASGIHEVAAQLREYAAYFEQDKYKTFVREKYGLRVYRPRLIAIVGRDMKQMNDDEFRRAMTMYDNLQFLTFDELLIHAKRRMLI